MPKNWKNYFQTSRKNLVLADDRADKAETVRRSKTLVFRRFAAAAAVLVLLIGGVAGFNGYNVAKTVAATISLDVNPSIEINTNAKDRVLSVNALNEDAETVRNINQQRFQQHVEKHLKTPVFLQHETQTPHSEITSVQYCKDTANRQVWQAEK